MVPRKVRVCNYILYGIASLLHYFTVLFYRVFLDWFIIFFCVSAKNVLTIHVIVIVAETNLNNIVSSINV
jgi:hypothetical protein